MGHAVAQLVEALRYKSEGSGFDSRWCHWNFTFALSFRPHYGPGVDSVSNRNEYQEYFLGVKAASAQGSQPYHLHMPIFLKSGSLKLLEPSGPVQACNGIALLCHVKYVDSFLVFWTNIALLTTLCGKTHCHETNATLSAKHLALINVTVTSKKFQSLKGRMFVTE